MELVGTQTGLLLLSKGMLMNLEIELK